MLNFLFYLAPLFTLSLVAAQTASSLPQMESKQNSLLLANNDLPLCFFQTKEGRIVNLERLCSSASSPTVIISRLSSDANFVNGQVINRSQKTVYNVKVNYKVLSEDGSIEEQSIDVDPPILSPNQMATFETVIPAGGTLNRTSVTWDKRD